MESITRYLLVSSIVLFGFVFYRWLLRYLRRNELQATFPYVFPFARQLFTKPESLRFELTLAGNVVVKLSGEDGRILAVLLERNFAVGTHDVELDFSNLAAGAYELKIEFPNQTTTRHIKLYMQ